MATVVALDASPASVLRSLRGPIVAARHAYPDVLHLEVRDPRGDVWRFATQDAEWSPSDPAELVERSIEDAGIDEQSGELRLRFSDGSSLRVEPAPSESDGDPPNWKLITPDGLVLEFGPAGRWHIDRADQPRRSPAAETREMVKRRLSELDEERKRLERALAELGGEPAGPA